MLNPLLRARPWLLAALSACLVRADSASDMILNNIEKRVQINSPGAHPFQLEADFTAQMITSLPGHITWKWLNEEVSSQEITIGPYHQIQVHKGDTSLTVAMDLSPLFA